MEATAGTREKREEMRGLSSNDTASGRAVQKPGLPRADGHDFLCYGKPMTMIKQVSHPPPASLPAVVWVAVVQTTRAHLSQGNSATAEPGKALQNHFGVGNTAVSVVP